MLFEEADQRDVIIQFVEGYLLQHLLCVPQSFSRFTYENFVTTFPLNDKVQYTFNDVNCSELSTLLQFENLTNHSISRSDKWCVQKVGRERESRSKTLWLGSLYANMLELLY